MTQNFKNLPLVKDWSNSEQPSSLLKRIAGKFGLIIVRFGKFYQLQDPHNIENSYPADLMTLDEVRSLIYDAAEMKGIL